MFPFRSGADCATALIDGNKDAAVIAVAPAATCLSSLRRDVLGFMQSVNRSEMEITKIKNITTVK